MISKIITGDVAAPGDFSPPGSVNASLPDGLCEAGSLAEKRILPPAKLLWPGLGKVAQHTEFRGLSVWDRV